MFPPKRKTYWKLRKQGKNFGFRFFSDLVQKQSLGVAKEWKDCQFAMKPKFIFLLQTNSRSEFGVTYWYQLLLDDPPDESLSSSPVSLDVTLEMEMMK